MSVNRFAVVAGVLVVALVGAFMVNAIVGGDDDDPITVVHWSNSHPMREGLMPEMAEAFNDAEHEVDGRRIEVELVSCDSATQVEDLVARIEGSGRADNGCVDGAADPTIVTPQSTDWLVDMNHRAGRDVVDLASTEHVAETWLGIATYREMAECLGWPDRELGYADIIALRADPRGWAGRSCAEASWGRTPLLAFTNPNTSTSGRNVLVSMYSIAAGKPPADLTVDDVRSPEVVAFVEQFQQLVDHYQPTTTALITKIVQGPRYGHFFLMPEDNLVSLFKGQEEAIGEDGTEQAAPPVKDLVMIYPKEGAVLNANPAGVVQASWVSGAEAEAAAQWIEFLRGDEQQRAFGKAGFRPAAGTGGEIDARQFARWGLDARDPTATIEPGEVASPVLREILDTGPKKPAIVTLVVDTSGSMQGRPLANVKDGLNRLLDAMTDDDDLVGLVTFSDSVETTIPPAPLGESKFDISEAIVAMEADGSTALYDAVAQAVELTDAATGPPGATRAVVVLSDGQATEGEMCLHELVRMATKGEEPVVRFCGIMGRGDVDPVVRRGDGTTTVPRSSVVGEELALAHTSPVQVFFLGFGEADIDVGRILAQATSAEYQGSTQDDLAAVIETLSGYF